MWDASPSGWLSLPISVDGTEKMSSHWIPQLYGLKPSSRTPIVNAQIPWQVKTVSIFGLVHYCEPHGTLRSVNGRGEEGGSSWYGEQNVAYFYAHVVENVLGPSD